MIGIGSELKNKIFCAFYFTPKFDFVGTISYQWLGISFWYGCFETVLVVHLQNHFLSARTNGFTRHLWKLMRSCAQARKTGLELRV